uniref:Zinc C6 transcription factor n=1 Tax=Cladonia uncialis subsp. uncialis TaxID=180999 RepID=A0A1Z1CED1_CLAUC|nr:putative zinc c6 transcription factor [Cladonia uncialis subsp. uncialis]AUW30901.1 zinc C6 transcription factor [Cladonia uncialis subsp. uncialis]
MVKRNHKSQAHRPKNATQSERINLSVLHQELELWYRLHVLLYDLNNVANDPSSEKRICSTTNELYISEPYFTDSEAIRIRTAIVDGILGDADEAIDAATNVTGEAEEGETTAISKSDSTSSTLNNDATVEEVIHNRLSNFFNKRKASGDARPCGPHDMLPIYLSVFSVGKEELKDNRFLSRLKRSGLGDRRATEGNRAGDQSMKHGKEKKKDKKDS